MGAQLVKHKVNYLTALAGKARADAERSGWELIAFGLESQEYFDQTRRQVANLPKDIKRIVTVAGSGMTLAAILAALDQDGRMNLPVLAVTIGHNPTPLLDRWAPSNWRSRVELRPADTRYEQPAAVTTWHGIELDPYYEAKAAPFVTEGDLFWIVATRDIAQPDQALLTWIEGDAADASSLAAREYDLVFTCPPYGNLEKYSDDPRDLSALPFVEMADKYRAIIAGACAMLRDNRFAAIVVGDYRDPQGNYRNFVSLTIDAFLRAGLALYNEAILVTQVGSLPIRVRKQFEGARKLGKTHQNVLVFVKGDPRKATAAVGPVDVAWPEEVSDESTDADAP